MPGNNQIRTTYRARQHILITFSSWLHHAFGTGFVEYFDELMYFYLYPTLSLTRVV